MSNMHEKRYEGAIARLRSPERVERLQVDQVVELCLEKSDVFSVLDVGTGTGLFAQAFARRGLTVSGVDLNPEMLASASRFVPQGKFQEGMAEALPHPDQSFDLVFLGLVLHESDETPIALREAFRVARIEVAILEWPYRDESFGPPLAHRLNPENLTTLFQKAGFHTWTATDLSNTVLYRLEV